MRHLPLVTDFSAAPPETLQPALDAEQYVPHVIAWNITRRCNLECAHCYISAGSWQAAKGELSTEECKEVVEQLLEVNPSPMLILSGGEPLVRPDLEIIAEHAASRGATVVVGTNGTGLTERRIASLKAAGVRGVAVSIDSLDATYHNRFRHGEIALEETVAAIDRLAEAKLDFIVQTSVTRGNRHEVDALVRWSAERGAVSFNLYFLVPTGRGEGMVGLSPTENDELLKQLVELSREFRGTMMIRSKCQPQLMRHVYNTDPESPLLNYQTRCPCGQQYCRITPEGKVTPCPYAPEVVGDLRQQSFKEVWRGSPVLARMRGGELGGKCGSCEYREICGGCRARALAQGGDLMGPDESCAYEPSGSVPLVENKREVTYGMPAKPTLEWSADAEARMQRIPSFVRGVVTRRVEDYAQRNGHSKITTDLLDDVRKKMPIDFSKKLPFFLRKDE